MNRYWVIRVGECTALKLYTPVREIVDVGGCDYG